MVERREAAKALAARRDADAADAERAQRDQQQHLAGPLGEAAGAAGGFALVGDPPTAFGKAFLEGFAEPFERGAGRKGDAIGAGVEAARLDQPRGVEPGAADQHGRREREPRRGGKLVDDPGDPEVGKAEAKRAADTQRIALGQLAPDRGLARAAGMRPVVEGNPAGGGPAFVHARQVDERGLAADLRGAAQGHAFAHGAEAGDRGAFLAAWRCVARRSATGRRRAARGPGLRWCEVIALTGW